VKAEGGALQAAVEIEPVTDNLDAVEQIFKANSDRVFRAAYRVTGNAADAEDVLQTVFLRLVRRDTASEPLENVEGYLHRAAVNAALDLIRARRDVVELDRTAELKDSSLSPERRHSAGELREWLRGAIARLHPTASEMFVLRYFDDLTPVEVAQRLNTTEGVVAVTLHRARTRLREELRAFMGAVK
jgi:RNA polymerase sigma-70 factor (ECF subfamily)